MPTAIFKKYGAKISLWQGWQVREINVLEKMKKTRERMLIFIIQSAVTLAQRLCQTSHCSLPQKSIILIFVGCDR